MADWESEVNAQGELFYIESLLQPKALPGNSQTQKDEEIPSVDTTHGKNKDSSRKTAKGRLN